MVLINLIKIKMKKIFCIKCNKYTKFKNPKISYIFNETLVPSIICSKIGNNNNNIFKENTIEILKPLGLIVKINQ